MGVGQGLLSPGEWDGGICVRDTEWGQFDEITIRANAAIIRINTKREDFNRRRKQSQVRVLDHICQIRGRELCD